MKAVGKPSPRSRTCSSTEPFLRPARSETPQPPWRTALSTSCRAPARGAAVALQHAGFGLDLRPASPREASCNGAEQLTGVEPLEPKLEVPLLGAGQQQQVVGDPGEPVGLPGSRLDRGTKLIRRTALAQGKFQFGLQQRERRPQLVACVRDEPALARQPVLDALEHQVQCLPQPGDLIPAGGNGQPLVERTTSRSPARGGASPPSGAMPRPRRGSRRARPATVRPGRR